MRPLVALSIVSLVLNIHLSTRSKGFVDWYPKFQVRNIIVDWVQNIVASFFIILGEFVLSFSQKEKFPTPAENVNLSKHAFTFTHIKKYIKIKTASSLGIPKKTFFFFF